MVWGHHHNGVTPSGPWSGGVRGNRLSWYRPFSYGGWGSGQNITVNVPPPQSHYRSKARSSAMSVVDQKNMYVVFGGLAAIGVVGLAAGIGVYMSKRKAQ